MHILLIHQAFRALDEAGGTRHHETALYLANQGHKVTIITSPISYLTGAASTGKRFWVEEFSDGAGVTILRVYTYSAIHRSFSHRVLSFISFMFSSFVIGLRVNCSRGFEQPFVDKSFRVARKIFVPACR